MSRQLNGKLPLDIAAEILEDIIKHPLTDDQALVVVEMLLAFDKQDSQHEVEAPANPDFNYWIEEKDEELE